jgi:hypothetical protein
MAEKKPLQMPLDDNAKAVIADLRKEIPRMARGTGVYCPCCSQLVKLYPREITGSMAYVAILLHRYFSQPSAEPWLHVPEYLSNMSTVGAAVRGGDWAKLRYWELIEEKPPEKVLSKRADGSKRVGMYRMTPKGHAFCKGEIKVQKSVLLYNDKLIEFGKGEVGIQDCLRKAFNYEALMAGKLSDFDV